MADQLLTVEALLSSLKLSHLTSTLTDESFEAWAELKRTDLLSRLKAKGVEKLAERQSIANGFSKAQRGLQAAAAPPPEKPVTFVSDAPRKKGRLLCLHGGSSSGEIMRMQLQRFQMMLGDSYSFHFPNGPTKQPMDPDSPQARILNTYFEGLPVLRWMNIIDKETGKDANLAAGGLLGDSKRKDKDGNETTLLEHAEKLAAQRKAEAPSHAPTTADDTKEADAAAHGLTWVNFGGIARQLSGEHHAYADAGLALRTLATYVKQHGPFDGAIGFSQGANTLALWLSLIEAGVLPYEWAAPKWACLICATQWGWASAFDDKAEELAQAIGPGLGARTPDEVIKVAANGSMPHISKDGEPPPRLKKLMTSGPLGIPSIHLIAEKDPSRLFSVATVDMYAERPTEATATLYGCKGCDEGGFKVVVEHPNDHMPPRQKEVVAKVVEFAERFDPRAVAIS